MGAKIKQVEAPAEEQKAGRWRLGWLRSRFGRKPTPVEAPTDISEEDLKTLFANDNMKLAIESLNSSDANLNQAVLQVPDLDDPVEESKEKEPPQMIPGHELLGDVPVVFQPKNVMTKARVGQPLSEVASQADVFIRYKCRKGQCKTCVVNIDGKWVSACQAKIPPMSPGQTFNVYARPVSEAHKDAEKAAFFSPKSIADGALNNALGMVGFVKDGMAADPDFEIRMERERAVQEMVRKRKEKAPVSSKLADSESVGKDGEYLVPGGLAIVFFVLTLSKIFGYRLRAQSMREPLCSTGPLIVE